MRILSALLLVFLIISFSHTSDAQTFTVSPLEVVHSDGSTDTEALFQKDEIVRISWTEQLSSGTLKLGTSPQVYDHATASVSGTEKDIIPEDEGLSTGKYYAVVTNSDENTFSEIQSDAENNSNIEFSQEFRLIVESSTAPTIEVPRGTIEETTPTFEWEAISGVPAYWVVVSSTPFEITRNEETDEIEVQGANVVWQVITTNTSIQYGTINPDDAFPNIQPPPLESGKEYNYTVLNVFSEDNLALASDVFGSVVSFSLGGEEELPAPTLSNPPDSTTIYGDETITLDWDPVQEANDYSVYVLERTIEGGSEVDLPIWNTSTTNTLVDFPAASNLRRGTYVWYVVPNDASGAGNDSEIRIFDYEVEMGEFRFRTRSTRTGDNIVGATVDARSLDRGYTPRNPFIARGQATLTDSLPAGTYEFKATLGGFADTTVTVDVEAATRTNFDINMRPLPSTILGTVVDEEESAVQNADVTVTNTTTGDTRTTTTNASGEFNVSLPPGTYDIEAGGAGLISSDVRTITLSPDENHTLASPLSVTNDEVPVSGTVVNQQGEALQLAQVTATSGDAEQEVSTNGSGGYSFVLSSGEWVLEANKSGFVGSDPEELSLSPGDNVQNQNFTLTARANKVSGTVFEVVTLSSGDTDLAAFEEATVTATPASGDPKSTTTLDNGQYSLDLGSGTYTIQASAEGYSSSESIEATFDVGETLEGIDFELTPNSAEINGQVTLPDGTPVEDATVSIENIATAKTLSSGAYTLSVPPGSYGITVSKEGLISPSPDSVSIGPDGVVTGINFTMTPNAGTISGTVTSSGETVPNATVTAFRDDQTVSTTTTDLGEYSLSVSPDTWALQADKSGFASSDTTTLTVGAGQQSSGNDFDLQERVALIRGTVTDGSSAIRGATVTVTGIDNADDDPKNSQTQVDGGFSISAESGNSYRVQATKQGFRSDADTTDTLSPEEETSLSLQLTPTPASIEGIVADENGGALSGALVRALQDGDAVDSTTTDVDGSYSLSLEDGDYLITASLGGYSSSQRETTLDVGEDVGSFDFTLAENFSTLRGTITDDSSDAVPDALISVSGPSTSSVRSESDGSYILTGLSAGSYEVDVSKSGFEDRELEVALEGGTSTREDVTLPVLRGQIQGQISTADGTSLEGATVTARSSTNQTFSTVSESDGSYRLSSLPVGTYEVSASLSGFSSDEVVSATISEDSQETTANISDFTANEASISGIVTDSTSDAPLLDATVTLSGSEGTGSDATNTSGEYEIDGLAPGTYTVTVEKSGFSGPTREVDLENGESRSLDLSLGPNTGEIVGTVIGSDGDPLDFSVSVKATSGGLTFTATTDDEGSFSMGGVENGREYTVSTEIFQEGYSNTSATLTFPEGTDSAGPVELEVPKRTATIAGSTGTPQASVQLIDAETGETISVTESQSDAVYQFDLLPAGTYTVRPAKEGYTFSPNSQTVDLSTDQSQTVDFEATSATGAIEVTIDVDADRSPEGVQVKATGTDNNVSRNQVSDETGEVTFEEVPAGSTYELRATLDGFTPSPSSESVSPEQGATVTASFTLMPNESAIRGRVADDDGAAISAATVAARNIEEGNVTSTETDNQGNYALDELPPGIYEVVATEPGFVADTTEVALDPGMTQDNIDFELIPSNVRLVGTVRQADGTAEGVDVTANGRATLTTTTNANGRFVFPTAPIRTGEADTTTYEITVSGADFATQRKTVDIPSSQAGETIEVDDFLLPSGQITLTVTDRANPLSGVGVTLTRPGGQSKEKVTGSDGKIVSESRLPAGTYRVSASKEGYLSPASAALEYELDTDTSRIEATLPLPYRHIPPDSVRADQDAEFDITFEPETSVSAATATLFYKEASSQTYESVEMEKSDASFTGILPAQFSVSDLEYFVQVEDEEAGITYTSPERTIEPLAAGILSSARLTPSLNDSRLRVDDTYDVEILLRDGLNESVEEEFVGEEAVGKVSWSLNDPSAGTIRFPDDQDSTRIELSFEQEGQYHLDIQAQLRGSLLNRSATVQVADPELEEVSVSSPTSRLSNQSGGTQLSVSAVDTTGANVLLGEKLAWSASPEEVATVSETGFLSVVDSTFIGPVTVNAKDTQTDLESTQRVKIYATVDGQTDVTLRGRNGTEFTLPAGAVPFPAEVGLGSGTQAPPKKQIRPLGSDQRYKVADDIRKFTFRADQSLPGDSLQQDAILSFRSPPSLRLHEGERRIGWFDKTEARWQMQPTENNGDRLRSSSVRQFGEYAVMTQNRPLNLREVSVLPNPFSPEVSPLKIGYFLDTNDPPAEVTIRIFNVRGELVRTLLDDDLQNPGRYGSQTGVKEVTWNGMTDGGLKARNGRYIIEIKARDQTGVVTERVQVVLVK